MTFLQSILVLFSSTSILKFLKQESFIWEAQLLKISEKSIKIMSFCLKQEKYLPVRSEKWT